MRWLSTSATHAGKLRSRNEDALLDRGADHLWVIADGMGGHEAGDVASSRLVERLSKVDAVADPADMLDRVEDALGTVNDELLAYSRDALAGRMLGCTVTVFSIAGPLGWVLWAGDCRLYRARDGAVATLTEDHTRVAELLRDGSISAHTARQYSANVVTRAAGVAPDLRLDCAMFAVTARDRFLICSDGLYNGVSSGQIARQLTGRAPAAAADALMRNYLSGEAKDNASLIVVWQDRR